jgi:hypothetical protein
MGASRGWSRAVGFREQGGPDQRVYVPREDRAHHGVSGVFAALKRQERASSDQTVTFRALYFV